MKISLRKETPISDFRSEIAENSALKRTTAHPVIFTPQKIK